MTHRFDGKTALLTGGGKGIGRATVLRLLAEGASVGVIDLEPEDSDWIESLKIDAGEAASRMIYLRTDVTSESEVEDAVARCTDTFGPLGILINNVGYSMPAADLVSISFAEWTRAFSVNLDSAFLMCRAALPQMRKAGTGAIVNLSSIAGAQIASGAHANYHAAKAAIVGLTNRLAFDEGANGIRVNAVSPGSVMTERIKPRYDAMTPEEYKRRMASIPLGRGSRPEEIAAAILFLASDDASYITGTNLHVNGGRYMA